MKTLPSSATLLLLLAGAFCPSVGCAAADDGADELTDEENVDIDESGVGSDKIGKKGYIGAYKSPSIVRTGATYHAYFARDSVKGESYNMPHATFTDDGTWDFVGEALPHLGKHADETGGYPVWAPGVAKISDDHWVAYYTAHLAGTAEKKCIWRAHAKGPNGPFVDDFDGPMVCGENSHWALDAYPVKPGGGDWHLAVRLDRGNGINTISMRRLTPNGQHFAPDSKWDEQTHNAPDGWEQPVLENAGVVRLKPPDGDAHWFVFYSGRAWDDNSYAIGYADCGPSIHGPCVKKTQKGPWMGTNSKKGLFGPGTPTFYKNQGGETLMSIQAWQFTGGQNNPKNDKGQIMRTYRMSVTNDYVPKAALVRIDL